tara:strand:+ start:16596 stop:16907 length:312 start_codon:yes stop_codon:yes gene_type:complete
MKRILLILYTRSGCCLCEGLEERLREIPLKELNPSLDMKVVDIDRAPLSEKERLSYDLRVPVMVLAWKEPNRRFELPRVSPRIKEKALFEWMQKIVNQISHSL